LFENPTGFAPAVMTFSLTRSGLTCEEVQLTKQKQGRKSFIYE